VVGWRFRFHVNRDAAFVAQLLDHRHRPSRVGELVAVDARDDVPVLQADLLEYRILLDGEQPKARGLAILEVRQRRGSA